MGRPPVRTSLTYENGSRSCSLARAGVSADPSCHRPMPDGEDSDDALVAIDLIDDPVDTDAKRPQSTKPPLECVAGIRFAFEEAERFDDGIGQGPLEVEDLLAGSPGELDPAHLRLSAVERSAQLIERHGLPRSTSWRPSSMAASISGSERISAVSSKASYSPTGRPDNRLRGEGSNLQHLAPKASVLPIELPRNGPADR